MHTFLVREYQTPCSLLFSYFPEHTAEGLVEQAPFREMFEGGSVCRGTVGLNANPVPNRLPEAFCQPLLLSQPNICTFDVSRKCACPPAEVHFRPWRLAGAHSLNELLQPKEALCSVARQATGLGALSAWCFVTS